MNISKDCVVTLHYTLTDDQGTVIDKSNDGSFAYLHGASNIIPGLENALEGKAVDDEFDVTVSPEEGYGLRDEARLEAVPREMFPADTDIEPGMQFHAQGPEGQMIVVTVNKVEDDTITIDGNHPLAGVTLNFAVKVIDIRDASAEEIEHGHVHGPEGHAH